MNDKYVDEIRAIRDRQYEETKNMTPEEEAEYSRAKVDWAKNRLQELRTRKVTEQPLATGKALSK